MSRRRCALVDVPGDDSAPGGRAGPGAVSPPAHGGDVLRDLQHPLHGHHRGDRGGHVQGRQAEPFRFAWRRIAGFGIVGVRRGLRRTPRPGRRGRAGGRWRDGATTPVTTAGVVDENFDAGLADAGLVDAGLVDAEDDDAGRVEGRRFEAGRAVGAGGPASGPAFVGAVVRCARPRTVTTTVRTPMTARASGIQGRLTKTVSSSAEQSVARGRGCRGAAGPRYFRPGRTRAHQCSRGRRRMRTRVPLPISSAPAPSAPNSTAGVVLLVGAAKPPLPAGTAVGVSTVELLAGGGTAEAGEDGGGTDVVVGGAFAGRRDVRGANSCTSDDTSQFDNCRCRCSPAVTVRSFYPAGGCAGCSLCHPAGAMSAEAVTTTQRRPQHS